MRYGCSFWNWHMEFRTGCIQKSMHLELGMCKWWIAKKYEQKLSAHVIASTCKRYWLSGWNLPVSQPSLYGLEFHFLSWSCHAHNELCKSQQLSGRHFFPIFAQQFFSRVLLQNDRQKMRGENPDRTCYCPQGVATQTHECPMLHTPGCKLFSHTVSHFYSRTTFTPHKSMFLLTIFMV